MVSGSCAWTSITKPKSVGRFPLTSCQLSPASSLRITSQCFCMYSAFGRDGCMAMRCTQWPTSPAGSGMVSVLDAREDGAQAAPASDSEDVVHAEVSDTDGQVEQRGRHDH